MICGKLFDPLKPLSSSVKDSFHRIFGLYDKTDECTVHSLVQFLAYSKHFSNLLSASMIIMKIGRE